jgi:hypothetical protein
MKRIAIMVLLMIGFGGGTMGQAPPQKLPDKTRILFLLGWFGQHARTMGKHLQNCCC